MSEQFFSEDGCDKWIAENLQLPDRGFYVDAGCAHPWRFSQIAFLRNRGWTGLAIDGNPAYAPEWEGVANAKFVHALLSDKQTEKFLIEPSNALVSRVHAQGQETAAKSLLDLLGDQRPDFIALDLEGMEAPVLKDYLNRIAIEDYPEIIVAEFNSTHLGRDVRLFNGLIMFKYCLQHLTDSNAVFTIG